jgi:nucleoside-diphosphate-sugar epimerase
MNIIVTGGAGYIGSHVCKELKKNKFNPIVVDDLSTGHKKFVKWEMFTRTSPFKVDIINKSTCKLCQFFFDCYEQIATLSAAFTLEPGDVVLTGTPSGVGIGFDPKKFLHVGDRVKIQIGKLGFIENEVIAEPASTVVI